MTYADRDLAAAVDSLGEPEKLYATLVFYEGVGPGRAAELLGLGDQELAELAARTLEALGDVAPLAPREVRALQRNLVAELRLRYERLTGDRANEKGRVSTSRKNVVSTVPDAELEQALADVGRGSGGELRRPKSGAPPGFHSVRSSCALAVSVFGHWRLQPQTLTLAGHSSFERLEFEVQFPILEPGTVWRTPPNLDVMAWRPDHVVAVESKFLEQIDPKHSAAIDASYDEAIAAADPRWRERVNLLRESPDEYRYFNAAQVIKHYLGLKADRPATIKGRPVTLLYIYWEPRDSSRHRFFAQHRGEIAGFADGLGDDQIQFDSLSYPELWRSWQDGNNAGEHVQALETRYAIDVPGV